VAPLDFADLTLEFHAPDVEAFPLLALARDAGERGGTAPCVFNAANEVAVEAFLEERIRFADIAEIVAAALETLDLSPARDVEELTAADAQTRSFAEGALSRA
jgi:1-deoxy-D-xylulose-5-phosphate reductoisomerase